MSVTNGLAMSIFSNYAREIDKYWKCKEAQQKTFQFNSPQLELRNHLVDWLRNVSEKLKVSYRTIHLAIHVLDLFMDNHSITRERLGFVALVCLMLAAKFEELDSKIPKISELNKFDGFRYSNRDFITVELMILKFLDFGLNQPTIAHFAEYYSMVTVIPQDLTTSTVSFRCLGEIAFSVIAEFLDICLKEVKFVKHLKSKVAAACILATRKHMNLTPAWTSVLIDVTGYSEENLQCCYNLLMTKLEEEKARRKRIVQSPDQGYISDKD